MSKNGKKQASKSFKATAPAAKQKPAAVTAKAKSKTSATKSEASASSAATGADKSGEFTGIAIGHAAGDVWGALSEGPRTIADIKKSVQAPADVVVAAIGWLAREDKLEFITNGKTVRIGLR